MYRAVSLALFGSEDYHAYLRLLGALEMVSHRNHYDIDAASYSNTITDNRIVTPSYDELVRAINTNGSYAELMHMYAVSAAVGVPLHSFCPSLSMTIMDHPYTKEIRGREVRAATPPIQLLWTMMSVPKVITMLSPNHMVHLARKPDRLEVLQIASSSAEEQESEEEVLNDSSAIVSDHGDRQSKPQTTSASELSDFYSAMAQQEVKVEEDEDENHGEEGEEKEEQEEGKEESEEEEKGPQLGAREERKGMLPLPFGKFLDTSSVINCLRASSSKTQSSIPRGLKENVYFVINNEANACHRLNKQRSVYEDDCGAWLSSKCPTTKTVYVRGSDGNWKSVKERKGVFVHENVKDGLRIFSPYDPQPDPSTIIYMHRQYAQLKNDENYTRRISCLSNVPKVALVEYTGLFPGRHAHGNAKNSDDSYMRTPSATLGTISTCAKSTKNPKEIYTDLLVTDSKKTNTQPRNLKQVQNLKYNTAKAQRSDACNVQFRANVADEVLHVLNLTQTSSFVQCVTVNKERMPCVILYKSEQLNLIRNFCFNSEGSVLCVDKTYNLGSVFVTCTVFKHKAVLRRSTDDEPIFIGPMFLHAHSDFYSFSIFFNHLSTCLHDCDESKLIIGSDDEKAMRKAIQRSFPNARLIMCFRHLQENLRRYLANKIGVNIALRNDCIQLVLGSEGLAMCNDVDSFEQKKCEVALLLQDKLTVSMSSSLTNYLEVNVYPMLRDNIIAKKQGWNNNNSESINHVFKLAVNWKPHMLPDLIQKLENAVETQLLDSHRAIFGRGDFKLKPSHVSFRISLEQWEALSEQQKEKVVTKCFVLNPASKLVTSSNNKFTMFNQPQAGKKKNQIKRKRNSKTTTVTKKFKA